METRTRFCPDCGHRVRLTAAPGPTLHGQANLADGGEVVCLDFDTACCGDACPLTGRPGVVMAHRLARSHLADDRLPRARGRCPACGSDAELERLDEGHVYCTVCETSSAAIFSEFGEAEA